MLKVALSVFLMSLQALANQELPDKLTFWNALCPPSSPHVANWEKDNGDIETWLILNRVKKVQSPIPVEQLVQLAHEFEKVPQNIREQMRKNESVVHLIYGKAVTDDPSFGASKTFDGRNWSDVIGAGGAPFMHRYGKTYPTRVVVNRLYDYKSHGSQNVFLHEHGHSIDSINQDAGISRSKIWRETLSSDPGLIRLLSSICGKYCMENANEAFAEAFAFHYSCDNSRRWMEKHAPQAAAFMRMLESADLRKIK